jgi:hypothetical protein
MKLNKNEKNSSYMLKYIIVMKKKSEKKNKSARKKRSGRMKKSRSEKMTLINLDLQRVVIRGTKKYRMPKMVDPSKYHRVRMG